MENPEQKKWHENQNTDMLMKINFNMYKMRMLLEKIYEEGLELRSAQKKPSQKKAGSDDFLGEDV